MMLSKNQQIHKNILLSRQLILLKTTILDSKTPTVDPKSADPKASTAKAATENTKSAKTSTASQTNPEK